MRHFPIMFFRPFFWKFFVFTGVFFWGGISVLAQTTDFALWKAARNADNVPGWARQVVDRDFRNLTGTAREELLAKTLSALADIVADPDIGPSTRINAILTAGQLVSSEVSPGNPRDAYSAALPYLVGVYQKEDSPAYLKYGALLGIVRHTLLGIGPEKQDIIIDLLLETAVSDFGQDGVSPAVWDWFRQSALDGLSALKTVGTDGKVVAGLLEIIDHKSQELENLHRNQENTRSDWEQIRRNIELASKAAKTLGDLDYTVAKEIGRAHV
jgi:hypothetical protein